MREITLTVRGDTVHASRHRAGIQGEANATALVVTFDESWDGYAKTIVFWDALEQNPVKRVLTDNLRVGAARDMRTYKTTIPGEPLAVAGECLLVIDGYVDGTRARSMSVRLAVEEAPAADNAGEPADPMPEPYEQMQEEIEALSVEIQTVHQGVEEVREIKEDAAQSAEGAKNAAEEAGAANTAAQEAASNAEASEQAAAEHRAAAENAATGAEEAKQGALIAEEQAKTAADNAKASDENAAVSARTAGSHSTKAEEAAANAETAQGLAQEAAEKAANYIPHPPVVGENGNWWEWDGAAYVDTGNSSRGERGEKGEKGDPGDLGDVPIAKGSGENSIVIGAGDARGVNSVAGGTTDKSLVAGITGIDISTVSDTLIEEVLGERGSVIKEMINNPAEAIGDGTISYGLGNQSVTGASMAIGVATQAGARGFYIHKLTFDDDIGITISLTTKQKPYCIYKVASFTYNSNKTATWSDEAKTQLEELEVGDMVNIFFKDSSFYYCAAITSIDADAGLIVIENNGFITEDGYNTEITFSGLTALQAAFDSFLPHHFSMNVPEKPAVGIIDLYFAGIATGFGTIAAGTLSQAHGFASEAVGHFGFATGEKTIAGYAATSSGIETAALGVSSHAEGLESKATAESAHAEGYDTRATGKQSHAEGKRAVASGNSAHAEGIDTKASGEASHAEGNYTEASGVASHAEGGRTKAGNTYSHAEGYSTTANGANSHAEGNHAEASGHASHAEGYNTKASGEASHAEGYYTQAVNTYSHAEGKETEASGTQSHTEGLSTKATAESAHAEGYKTQATGYQSHAEGKRAVASGNSAHAEGIDTKASGEASHAEGYGTIATARAQHVQGEYNIEDTEKKYLHIVGNGTSEARSNAHTIDKDGNAWFAGGISFGQERAEAPKIQIKEYIGTGSFGSSHAKSLVFDFVPKIVIIKLKRSSVPADNTGIDVVAGLHDTQMIAFYGDNNARSTVHIGGTYCEIYHTHLRWDGKTLKLWGETATRHLNRTGLTYSVLAIG